MSFAGESFEKFGRGLSYKRGDTMLHLAVRNKRPAAFVRACYDAFEDVGALAIRNADGALASAVDTERRYEFLHGGHVAEEEWVAAADAGAVDPDAPVGDERFGHWRP